MQHFKLHCLFIGFLCLSVFNPVLATEELPLKPLDTSSPRAMVASFQNILNQAYGDATGLLKTYVSSDRLYPSPQEKIRLHEVFNKVDIATKSLDLSQSPRVFGQESARLLALQLKSIIDRIDLPDKALIPDADMMRFSEFKRWTIPDTEITIERIEAGPRAGEYLFNAYTVDRLQEFYNKIAHLPHREGTASAWYETYRYSGSGLVNVVPYRWFGQLPDWALEIVFEQPVWKWTGLITVLVFAFIISRLINGFCILAVRKMVPEEKRTIWNKMSMTISLVVIIPILENVIASNLRFIGQAYEIITLSLWSIFYLILSYMVWLLGIVLTEIFVSSKKLIAGSIDSQLIRLGSRLFMLIVTFSILIKGAQDLGLPAYSIVAGLGVSSLAVALAAQDSLANLLGSLTIMFEKPFRVGHWIRVDDVEGTVESIGFRSTRIRTFYNSLVSIPSKNLMNSTIDNMESRRYRRFKTYLDLEYKMPLDKIERFISGIKNIILSHELTRKDYYHVVLNEYGDYSLKILVYIFFEVPDWAAELAARDEILMKILKLAEDEKIEFAFPTQALHVQNLPQTQSSV